MRKIIQILDCPDTDKAQGCIMALCDDGTIWYLQGEKWSLIKPQIPQTDLSSVYTRISDF